MSCENCSAMYNFATPWTNTVHGILQTRILEWVAFPVSRGSSQPRDRTQASCITGRFWSTREALCLRQSGTVSKNMCFVYPSSTYLCRLWDKIDWVSGWISKEEPVGVIPEWIQAIAGCIISWLLSWCGLTVLSPAPRSVPDRMLHLFVERIDYSFSPIALQVSEVPNLSAFKTASGTVNALTVGSARSPWWGKASWLTTRKSSAANVALGWTLISRRRQSLPTGNPPCFCSH